MEQLTNNIVSRNRWSIEETKFDSEQIINTGSIFLIGNGYLGYRGTLVEWDSDQYVGCFITDTYDKADDKWKELSNAPNPLYTKVEVGGETLSLFNEETKKNHDIKLDLKHGIYKRETNWQTKEGIEVNVKTARFASLDNIHLIPMQYSITTDKDTNIKFKTGIDGEVWDLNGNHLIDHDTDFQDGLLSVQSYTQEMGIELDVMEGIKFLNDVEYKENIVREDQSVFRVIEFEIKKNETITFYKVGTIYSSNDIKNPYKTAIADCKKAVKSGYEVLKKANKEKWEEIWDKIDIKIEGDPINQTVLRFNLYHNIIATPLHSDELPIGARGLSCQAYQGAAFWDQEIFNLPMFLFTKPDIAKNLLIYRYKTLNGARQKAKYLGYKGAFYAWISGKTGQELCPSYFFKNVLTGRKIHNHFNDWQIHVSPDIAYMVWYYYQVTGDFDFIKKYGAEIVFEVARFLYSHSYYKMDKNRFEFIRLLGPDEYHENVDNNVYTNYISKKALKIALTFYFKLEKENPEVLKHLKEKINLKEKEIIEWEKMEERIYIPTVDRETKLIEQFDGYFDLEDVTPDVLEDRLIDEQEYWGWPNGVAVETQVIKQADVIQLFNITNEYSKEVMEKNFKYYEPRTQHGSSLSPSAYSIIASKVGLNKEAFDLFEKSLFIDIGNTNKAISGGTFIGGIHTAACGAAWQIVVKGFAGMEVLKDGILFKPNIPDKWDSFAFDLTYQNQEIRVKIDKSKIYLNSVTSNKKAVNFTIDKKTYKINPEEYLEIKY